MIRLFKYENCAEYSDYPNDLFRSDEYAVSFDFENDKVFVNDVPYKLSGLLHIQGSGSKSNSIESSLFQKIKTNVKLAFQSLFNC